MLHRHRRGRHLQTHLHNRCQSKATTHTQPKPATGLASFRVLHPWDIMMLQILISMATCHIHVFEAIYQAFYMSIQAECLLLYGPDVQLRKLPTNVCCPIWRLPVMEVYSHASCHNIRHAILATKRLCALSAEHTDQSTAARERSGLHDHCKKQATVAHYTPCCACCLQAC